MDAQKLPSCLDNGINLVPQYSEKPLSELTAEGANVETLLLLDGDRDDGDNVEGFMVGISDVGNLVEVGYSVAGESVGCCVVGDKVETDDGYLVVGEVVVGVRVCSCVGCFVRGVVVVGENVGRDDG